MSTESIEKVYKVHKDAMDLKVHVQYEIHEHTDTKYYWAEMNVLAGNETIYGCNLAHGKDIHKCRNAIETARKVLAENPGHLLELADKFGEDEFTDKVKSEMKEDGSVALLNEKNKNKQFGTLGRRDIGGRVPREG